MNRKTPFALSAASCALFLTLAGCDATKPPRDTPTPDATPSAAAPSPAASDTAATTPAADAGTPAPPAALPAGLTPFKGTGKAVTTPSGLKYEDMTIGKGETPKPGQYVSVNYLGTLMNGTKFDASYDRGQPIEFPLGQGKVIPGWDEGIASMKVGGRRRLTIPGNLAYGPAGTPDGSIPPNATLIFDVTLVSVSDTPKQGGM